MTNCTICDRHGLAWFTGDGYHVPETHPAGNTAYRCRHSTDWANRVIASIIGSQEGRIRPGRRQ